MTICDPNSPPSFADVFHRTQHRQSVCILAVLAWIAACDGKIDPNEQLLLDKLAEALDDAEDLAAIECAVRYGRTRDLELACRFLRTNLDRGGKRLMLQLAVTMAVQDGFVTVGENYCLQFVADLMGVSPRGLGKLFEQIAHRPLPAAGDPSSPDWWQRREAGLQAPAAELPSGGESAESDDLIEPAGPMTRQTALRVLGLEESATPENIHAAYRRLAKTRHPDRFSPLGPAAVATASEAFKRLHDAYAVLST